MCSEPLLSPYLFVSIQIVGTESACLLYLILYPCSSKRMICLSWECSLFFSWRASCWWCSGLLVYLPPQAVPLSQSCWESDMWTQSTGSLVTSHLLVLHNHTGGRAGVESTHKAAWINLPFTWSWSGRLLAPHVNVIPFYDMNYKATNTIIPMFCNHRSSPGVNQAAVSTACKCDLYTHTVLPI